MCSNEPTNIALVQSIPSNTTVVPLIIPISPPANFEQPIVSGNTTTVSQPIQQILSITGTPSIATNTLRFEDSISIEESTYNLLNFNHVEDLIIDEFITQSGPNRLEFFENLSIIDPPTIAVVDHEILIRILEGFSVNETCEPLKSKPIYQEGIDFTVSGNTITWSSPPEDGTILSIAYQPQTDPPVNSSLFKENRQITGISTILPAGVGSITSVIRVQDNHTYVLGVDYSIIVDASGLPFRIDWLIVPNKGTVVEISGTRVSTNFESPSKKTIINTLNDPGEGAGTSEAGSTSTLFSGDFIAISTGSGDEYITSELVVPPPYILPPPYPGVNDPHGVAPFFMAEDLLDPPGNIPSTPSTVQGLSIPIDEMFCSSTGYTTSGKKHNQSFHRSGIGYTQMIYNKMYCIKKTINEWIGAVSGSPIGETAAPFGYLSNGKPIKPDPDTVVRFLDDSPNNIKRHYDINGSALGEHSINFELFPNWQEGGDLIVTKVGSDAWFPHDRNDPDAPLPTGSTKLVHFRSFFTYFTVLEELNFANAKIGISWFGNYSGLMRYALWKVNAGTTPPHFPPQAGSGYYPSYLQGYTPILQNFNSIPPDSNGATLDYNNADTYLQTNVIKDLHDNFVYGGEGAERLPFSPCSSITAKPGDRIYITFGTSLFLQFWELAYSQGTIVRLKILFDD